MFGNSKDLSNPHPFIDVSSVPQYMKENIWESLLAVDLESEIHGMLAERWETSPDGKTWTFHLRPNVKFHDGKDLTAEDVVFSAGWVMNEENQAFGAAAMENVQDVTAVDPRTIRMTLKAQSAAFLSQISSIRAFSVVPSGSVPNGVTRIEGAPPPGTGPFKWESWQPNNEFRVTRFDGYWEGAPYLERVVFKLIPDDTARFNALRAGDLQAAERVGVQFARQILEGRITGISTYPARLSGFRRLVFNHRGDFFHDIRMREAVAYALDKEALLEEVYFGFATPAEIKMPPGSVWERAANLQPRLRDLDRSRRLLQEAGYNGQPIRGNGRRGSEHTNVWEAVTRQLAEVGINLDVEITESAVYEERQNSGQFDITLRGGNTDDDPSESLKPDYYSEPGPMRFANYSGHSNPELDRLFDLMEVQTNREERIETFKKLAKLMHDEIIDIPLGFAGDRFFATLDARVRNFSPTDGGGYTHRFGGLKKTWLVG